VDLDVNSALAANLSLALRPLQKCWVTCTHFPRLAKALGPGGDDRDEAAGQHWIRRRHRSTARSLVKVIRDKKYSEVVGAHIVGPHATELIAEFVVGRHLETTVEEMDRAMHPHPTLSEAVAEAALAALGHAVHI
jgi:hypothetical protein